MRAAARLAFVAVAVATCRALTDEERDALERETLAETLAAGRGDREEQGVRDQWLEGSGVGSRDDMKRPISKRVLNSLRQHGLTCAGCTNEEATKVVNAFVRSEKKRIAAEVAAEERRRRVLAFLVPLIGACVLGAFAYLAISSVTEQDDADFSRLDDEVRAAIRESQTYAEAMAEARAAPPEKAAPTWRDREELEEWTDRQEKQFRKALGPLLGLAPKERWRLVADQVDGKTKQECAAHYKLQQILEREAAEGKKDV